MPDETRKVAEKILSGMNKKTDGVCPNCGHDASDGNTFFDCESCGRGICSYCHRMTMDTSMICPQCVKDQGLTEDDLIN